MTKMVMSMIYLWWPKVPMEIRKRMIQPMMVQPTNRLRKNMSGLSVFTRKVGKKYIRMKRMVNILFLGFGWVSLVIVFQDVDQSTHHIHRILEDDGFAGLVEH